MGSTYTFFKAYKVATDEELGGDSSIQYEDIISWDLCCGSAAIISSVLADLEKMYIPVYDSCIPPESGVLQLIEPAMMEAVCNKVILALEQNSNPMIYFDEPEMVNGNQVIGELLFSEDPIKDCEIAIDHLRFIQERSAEGYYLTGEQD